MQLKLYKFLSKVLTTQANQDYYFYINILVVSTADNFPQIIFQNAAEFTVEIGLIKMLVRLALQTRLSWKRLLLLVFKCSSSGFSSYFEGETKKNYFQVLQGSYASYITYSQTNGLRIGYLGCVQKISIFRLLIIIIMPLHKIKFF